MLLSHEISFLSQKGSRINNCEKKSVGMKQLKWQKPLENIKKNLKKKAS